MKKTFIKILPLAAAVLFTTSCNKEDNNTNDNVVPGQEKVEKQYKTVTVTGKADKKQGISKFAYDSENNRLIFAEGDKISFSGDNGDITGEGTFTGNGGYFTATLKYPADENYALKEKEITATIGTRIENTYLIYDNMNAAVANIYETSSNALKLTDGQNEELTFDGTFDLKSDYAFLQNGSGAQATFKIGNDETSYSLDETEVLVVKGGTSVVVNGRTATVVANKVYTIAAAPAAAPTVTGKFTATMQRTVNYTVTSNHEGTLQYNNGADWVNVSNNVIEGLTPESSLSFRIAGTETTLASEATSAETVPEILSIQPTFESTSTSGAPVIGNTLVFPYCLGNTWADVAGVDENGRFTEGNNTYQIFDGDNPVSGTDVIDAHKTYTYKQVLTVTITVYNATSESFNESFNLTYYQDETWENVAARNNNVSIMKGQSQFVIINECPLGVTPDLEPGYDLATVFATDVVDNTKAYVIIQ